MVLTVTFQSNAFFDDKESVDTKCYKASRSTICEFIDSFGRECTFITGNGSGLQCRHKESE